MDLIAIGTQLKREYNNSDILSVDFYLPGNIKGVDLKYAYVFYPSDEDVKKVCKFTDKNDEPFDFRLSMTVADANALKSLKLKNEEYKTVIGKFIDQSEKKMIFVYLDSRDNKIFIADFFLGSDEPSNIVSPLIEKTADQTKFIISKEGDYIMLKDSIFSGYAIDEHPNPYYSIKSGV